MLLLVIGLMCHCQCLDLPKSQNLSGSLQKLYLGGTEEKEISDIMEGGTRRTTATEMRKMTAIQGMPG